MTAERAAALHRLLALPPEARVEPLVELAQAIASDAAEGSPEDPVLSASVVDALLDAIATPEGEGADRLDLGIALGQLGDPRLHTPNEAAYWASVPLDRGSVEVGRFLVTNQEWSQFVNSGGYANDAHWSAEGLAWRDSGPVRWQDIVAENPNPQLLVPNQPVVGVTWHEAMAYATCMGARLPDRDERCQIVRGPSKRPYPWGEPFGTAHANTREEVLGQPSAVGLYPSDCTPEGVYDLAGNVAEWALDEVGDKRVLHPGSWKQPSMASWAKALALRPPDFRADDLGFRLARG